MKGFIGTLALIRLYVRLERGIAPWWIGVMVLMAAGVIPQYAKIFPTQAARDAFAFFIHHNAMLLGFGGPIQATSLAGLAAWKISDILYSLTAVMALLTVIRHTRQEEEAGRLELLAAGAVGRFAPLCAAMLVACGLSVLTGALTTLAWLGLGLDPAGCVALGLAVAAAGGVFAGVGGVVAQLSASARTSLMLGLGAIALAWCIRFIGDATQQPWLDWYTPLGWSHLVAPFGSDFIGVLWLPLASTLILTAGSGLLLACRDLGSGLIPAKPRAAGGAQLGNLLALAWRLQRGAMLGWASGYLLMGLFVGNIAASGMSDLASKTSWGAEFISRYGGDGHASFAAMFMWILLVSLGTTATLYAFLGALRLRSEETSGHAEWILSTATSRLSWMASHIFWLVVGTTFIMLAGGLGIGLSDGFAIGAVTSEVPLMLAGALIQVPAIWSVASLVILAFGLIPRAAVGVAWVAFFYINLFGDIIGPLLGLHYRAANLLVPFYYLPKITSGGPFSAMPLVLLTLIAVLFGGVGLVAFSRRDLTV